MKNTEEIAANAWKYDQCMLEDICIFVTAIPAHHE